MNYFYHLVPEPFIGSKLIPLNDMDKDSELYQSHARKYVGRESLTEQVIPILDCKWNDVVQFSALNPQLIINELRRIEPTLKLQRVKCFKVSVEEVEGIYEGVVFNRSLSREKGDFSISSKEVQSLSIESYKEIHSVPKETLEYWNKVKETGDGKYLWFPYVPHIFLKGAVDTTSFEIIELS